MQNSSLIRKDVRFLELMIFGLIAKHALITTEATTSDYIALVYLNIRLGADAANAP